MSLSQPARPASGLGRALVWIIPCMSRRNQAGEPFTAGPEDAASLVCDDAIVAVNRIANIPAALTRYRFFIPSPLHVVVSCFVVVFLLEADHCPFARLVEARGRYPA